MSIKPKTRDEKDCVGMYEPMPRVCRELMLEREGGGGTIEMPRVCRRGLLGRSGKCDDDGEVGAAANGISCS
jgi:hypothetical protein